MLNKRLRAAHEVRDAFVGLKRESSDLATRAAECAVVMRHARSTTGLPIGAGHEALALVQNAAALLQEAESCLARAHPVLAGLIAETGLARHYVHGYGLDETPPPQEQRPRGLAQVA